MFSCSAELHIVHRVILRAMHWLWFGLTCPIGFRDLEITCNIHYCFRCTKFEAECVSVCLIVARGCSSVQATSPFKHTSNPLCGAADSVAVGGSAGLQTHFSL